MEQAIEMVERGAASAIVVYNISRASRSVVDFLGAKGRLEAAGGRIVSAQEQLDDSPTGVMLRTFF